jgi:hypothetical protein
VQKKKVLEEKIAQMHVELLLYLQELLWRFLGE